MLLEEGAAFSTDRHRGILLADGTDDSLGDRSGNRVNARSGEDDGGFGRAGGLGGFKLGDLGVSLGESDFKFLNLLRVGSGLKLEGFEFSAQFVLGTRQKCSNPVFKKSDYSDLESTCQVLVTLGLW